MHETNERGRERDFQRSCRLVPFAAAAHLQGPELEESVPGKKHLRSSLPVDCGVMCSGICLLVLQLVCARNGPAELMRGEARGRGPRSMQLGSELERHICSRWEALIIKNKVLTVNRSN